MGSRLALDSLGRRICIITTPSPRLEVGTRLLVRETWTARQTGRVPTARERATARPPYQARNSRQPKEEAPEDELDEAAGLEACRREQQREPVDLIGRVAA